MSSAQPFESPAITELKKQFSDVDSLHLVVPSIYIQDNNPFYKLTGVAVTVDIHERGAAFKMPAEKDSNGRWHNIYYLCKPTIEKFAAAAGISIVPQNSGSRIDPGNIVTGYVQVFLLSPDGSPRYVSNIKQIDLNIVKKNLYGNKRKNIRKYGLSGDEAKMAQKVYKGEMKQNGKYENFFIDASDEEAFLKDHVERAMVQEAKNIHQKAYTGAYLRAIRSALGINQTYSEEQLKKPFIITRMNFRPDFNDPAIRTMALHQGFSAMWELYGGGKRSSMLTDDYVDVDPQSGEVIDQTGNHSQAEPQLSPVNENSEEKLPEKAEDIPKGDAQKKTESPISCVCEDCGEKFGASTKYVANVKNNLGRIVCPSCAKKIKEAQVADAEQRADAAGAGADGAVKDEKAGQSSIALGPYQFVCKECGKVFDVSAAAQKSGMTHEQVEAGYQEKLNGPVCPSCMKKRKTA